MNFHDGKRSKGDIPSPLLWVAVCVIAVTALKMVHSGFKVLDMNCLAVEVSDIAYADDLVSVCASPAILQEKAEIIFISAWFVSREKK